jgi:hypothetical protein
MDIPWVPATAPYFTGHRSDFTIPEVIDLILGRVGVDRGDGVRRRFRLAALVYNEENCFIEQRSQPIA